MNLYDVIEIQDIYLILEYCQGWSLLDIISHNFQRFETIYTEQEASYVVFQVLLAINHMHSHNVCHRDIKPENIMVDENWNIKVIDMSISAFEQGDFTEPYGTPFYVAPEVIEGKYTKACDLWSLGVVIYVMLTGWIP